MELRGRPGRIGREQAGPLSHRQDDDVVGRGGRRHGYPVVGAEVARKLGYRGGEKIIIAHGGGEVSFSQHTDKPFTVVGILKPTGTPIDRTVHITLKGIEAMHVDWHAGAKIAGYHIDAEKAAQMSLEPDEVSAFLVGFKTRVAAFKLQREINDYQEKPVVTVCRTDRRSAKAVELLAQRGFADVHVVTNGMTGWNENGYPLADA